MKVIVIEDSKHRKKHKHNTKHKHQKVHLILTTYIHNYKIKIYAMQLQTKNFMDAILTLVDHDTLDPIQATFANIELTSSDPSIFTTTEDVDADGTVDIVGVAVGTGSLHVKTDVTYTDKNTKLPVTDTKEVDVDVTITEPAPDAEKTDLVVTFSDPKQVPTTPTT